MPKVKTTKLDILRCATEMILKEGFSKTTPKQICKILDISPGNLTYYFPTKEHILAELVHLLCSHQWAVMQKENEDGYSSVMAVCMELMAMAVICEEDPVAKEFYVEAYRSSMCLKIIRENDRKRAQTVFYSYCAGWTEEQFAQAEILVSGIEYATLMTAGYPVALEQRISGALDAILQIYQVPEEFRQKKIRQVLALDYRSIGKQILTGFREYVAEENKNAIEALLHRK